MRTIGPSDFTWYSRASARVPKARMYHTPYPVMDENAQRVTIPRAFPFRLTLALRRGLVGMGRTVKVDPSGLVNRGSFMALPHRFQ